MSIILKSGSSSDLAKVDTNNNLQVNLPTDSSQSGYVRILDADGTAIITTESGAIKVSEDSIILFEQVDGAALNTNIWNTSVSTQTIAQSGGFITLNSGSSTAINTYAILNSIKTIPMYGALPLKVSINAKVTVQPQANLTIELGIGTAATTSAPTDGAFFRWSATGSFLAVINNNGAEVTSGPLTPPPSSNNVTLFNIIIVEDLVQFLIDDVLVATLLTPAAQAFPTNAGRLPVFARTYNSASIPVQAPQLSIGQVIIAQEDMNQGKDWGSILAALGRGAYQSPLTPFTQTSNHANSTSPSSATLSNTAAGYTTLGGRYQFATLSGAATDFALFGFQIPTGFQFYVTGISISAMNTGAVVAVTATILDWSIGINSSAVSLATADSPPTSWAPRRIPLGMHGFGIAALVGATGNDIVRSFTPPLVVDSGRFLHVILQLPVGTATVSQVIRGDVTITGYFE